MANNNHLIKGTNDLLTWCRQNKEYGIQLMDEWTGKCSDGSLLSISDISKGSHKSVIWKCRICHQEWPASVKNRTSKNRTGCRFCCKNFNGGKYPRTYIKLDKWCQENEKTGSILIKEWGGNDENNNPIKMCDYYKGSMKKVQWNCSICGNVFWSRICDRTSKKGGSCPKCNKNSTSYPEQFLYYALKEAFPETLNRIILWDYEYDIVIPNIHLCIEYSPYFTHSKKIARDKEKKILCEKNNYSFILIREDKSFKGNSKFSPSLIEAYVDYNNKDEILKTTAEYIISLYSTDVHINWSNISELAFLGSHGYIEYSESLEYIYPELAKEWNYSFNGIKKPSSFSKCSSEKIYWFCHNCGYGKNGEWQAQISNRAYSKQGCPVCGYTWYDKKIHSSSRAVVIEGRNDLATLYPMLEKEWNTFLNKDSKPNGFRPSSSAYAFWVCTDCGYGKHGEWKTRISQRVCCKSGCPQCGYNIFDGTFHKRKKSIVPEKSISSMFPCLIKEWNQALNDQTTPKDVFSGSHTPYYWVCCKCGYGKKGEWKNTPNSRVNQKSGCPVCGFNVFDETYHRTTGRKNVIVGLNDLKTTCGNLWKEWHTRLNGALLPTQFKSGSHQLIYWQCTKCGYGDNGEWSKDIHSRVSGKSGCPKCRYNIFDGTIHKRGRQKK